MIGLWVPCEGPRIYHKEPHGVTRLDTFPGTGPWWISKFKLMSIVVCTCVCTGVSADVYGGQRTTLCALPQALPPLFLETESLTGMEITK